MNKSFSILFLLFIFIFTASIDSLPQGDFLRRDGADKPNKLVQCPGNFPITAFGYTYEPKVLVPGKNWTQHAKFESTIELNKGINRLALVYHKNELLYKFEEDFCDAVGKLGLNCPVPPGTYDFEATEPLFTSPDQPKDVTDEYLIYLTCKLPNIVSFDLSLIYH
jgi:hypothetical protein